jgi:virginiamycin B lyase
VSRRAFGLSTALAALLLAGACARGGSEQRVSSRGLEPTETTQPAPPAEATTSTETPTSSTEPATSSTTVRPTTTMPRPTSTTSTTAKPPAEPVCSPVATTFPLTVTGGTPGAVTVAADGAVWFTYRGTKSIGRLGPDGQAKLFPLNQGREAGGIATGPDGSIWFTQEVPGSYASGQTVPSDAAIGRIAPDGTITDFPLPTTEANPMGSLSFGVGPTAIVAGPDGAMWFIESGADKVGRITAAGAVTEFDLPERDRMHANPEDITVGPDGAIYVTETLRSRVARVDVATGVITELPPPGAPNAAFAGITGGP